VPERILVTGGAGFIGLALAAALVERGQEVWLLDDFSRGARDAAWQALAGNVRVIAHDLTRPLPAALDAAAFGTVYHLAARLGVEQVGAHPFATLHDNLAGVANLLQWARGHRGLRLCFTSTSEVYAEAVRRGLAPLPTPETAPLVAGDPEIARSAYAVSKIAGEHLVLQAARELGLRALVVRYHNVYGPRMGQAHVIPQFILRALDRAEPFAVFGVQTRAFCHVDDAVAATLAAMAVLADTPLIVNVGDAREEIRTDELARRVCRLAGYAPALAVHAAPPGSPERRVPDLARLHALTGFAPRVTLAAGLARTFEWYRAEWEAGGARRPTLAGSAG
jgi:UDP-glucuronate decarboxylase